MRKNTMHQREPSTNFLYAFTDGLRGRNNLFGNAFRIEVEQIAELLVTSGSIVACDPSWLQTAPEAYTTRVPLGCYPVLLSRAIEIADVSAYIACVQVRFTEQEVVRWEMAVRPGEESTSLKPGQVFGYGVDSGIGCFLDLDVLEWIFEQAGVHDLRDWRNRHISTPEERAVLSSVSTYMKKVSTRLVKEMGDTDTASATLNKATGGSAVMFLTGYGDGCYASYFGYAADGSLSCLVTDFGVLYDAQWEPHSAVPARISDSFLPPSTAEGKGKPSDLLYAFTDGLRGRNNYGEAFRIQVEQIAELLVTSGSIVACDPFWLQTAPEAYTTRVPFGRHPVLLSRADGRIACVQVRFTEQEVVRWEMAVCPGEESTSLKPGYFLGYRVLTGIGCFLDLDVLEWMFEQAGVHDLKDWRNLHISTPEERAFAPLVVYNHMKEVYKGLVVKMGDTSTAVTLNEATGGNTVMFLTGYGDGCYASYFGYAADGSLSCLVTDFGVLCDVSWGEHVGTEEKSHSSIS